MTTSVLSACQTFAKCANHPQVLGLLQKCFVRIKTAKQITVISLESRTKKWKRKKQQQQSQTKKDELGVEFVCLRHEISTKSNVKDSVRGNWAWLFQGFLKATSDVDKGSDLCL